MTPPPLRGARGWRSRAIGRRPAIRRRPRRSPAACGCRGLDVHSAQGDRGFFDLLAEMGARVALTEGGVEIAVDGDAARARRRPRRHARPGADARRAGAFRRGHDPHPQRARTCGSRRATGWRRWPESCGESAPRWRSCRTAWSFRASGRRRSRPRDPVVVEPRGDHRIAMSLALAGLRRPGVRIAHPEVVAKSYPGFWSDLDRLVRG